MKLAEGHQEPRSKLIVENSSQAVCSVKKASLTSESAKRFRPTSKVLPRTKLTATQAQGQAILHPSLQVLIEEVEQGVFGFLVANGAVLRNHPLSTRQRCIRKNSVRDPKLLELRVQ